MYCFKTLNNEPFKPTLWTARETMPLACETSSSNSLYDSEVSSAWLVWSHFFERQCHGWMSISKSFGLDLSVSIWGQSAPLFKTSVGKGTLALGTVVSLICPSLRPRLLRPDLTIKPNFWASHCPWIANWDQWGVPQYFAGS